MKFFHATLHKKINQNNPTQPASINVLLPIESIAALIVVNANSYNVILKPDCVPIVHFEVGAVSATLQKHQIEVL